MQDHLIKLLVPLTFFAIWALTSLFNRDAKPAPLPRPQGPIPGMGPRPGEPTLRWGPPPGSSMPGPNPANRRVVFGDDDIMILQPEPARTPPRPAPARVVPVARRGRNAKAAPAPPRKPEPSSSRPKLGGVSQNVNQHLNQSLNTQTAVSASAPTAYAAPNDSTGMTPPSQAASLSAALADPVRFREAFLLNVVLGPPVSLRRR